MRNWTKNQYHNPIITQIINDTVKMHQHYDKIELHGFSIPLLTKEKINELIKGKTECLICAEVIASGEDIWHCCTCYKIHHLSCIIKWVIMENEHLRKEVSLLTWKCPHCNTEYAEDDINNLRPNCYCSQNDYQSNMNHNEYNSSVAITVPHGCNAICSKAVCRHILACPLICHPGPHVECNSFEKKTCACGQTTRLVTCVELENEFYCDTVCNKDLPCQRHKCKSKCHKEPCQSLSLTQANQSCDECTNEDKEELIAFIKQKEIIEGIDININLSFIVTECIFNYQLPCNRHLVDVKTNQTQSHLKRLIKTNTINLKQLVSIFIPLCKIEVINACNCKKKSKLTACYLLNYNEGLLNILNIEKESKIGQCNNICSSLLQCRNHHCKRKCCELNKKYITNYSIQDPYGYHLCHLKCGKLLDCKRHHCEETCHPGKCPPCGQKITKGCLVCSCGKTNLNPPYPCNHKIECNMICDKLLNCGHYCEGKCHDGICPPCMKTSNQKCQCGKNTIAVLCSEPKEGLKCNSKCDKRLNCKVHYCALICHIHNDTYDQQYKCDLKCQRNLLSCDHLCQMKCHGDSPCDESLCRFDKVIQCKCGLSEVVIPCYQFKQGMIDAPCGLNCFRVNRLSKIKQSFKGIGQLTPKKILLLYPHINLYSEEIPQENIPFKYHCALINYAKSKINLIIKIEAIIITISVFIQNKVIKLNKNDIEPIIDWLVIYHRLQIERMNDSGISITDGTSYVKQHHRLSMIALLFKHSLFDHFNQSTQKCCKVYHPFAYTIGIVSTKEYSIIDDYIIKSGVVTRNDYYLNETKEGEYSIHLFSALMGKKLFELIKVKSFNIPQCYSHEYHHDKDDDKHLEDYLTDECYFNYLNNGYDDNYYRQYIKLKEKDRNTVDEDGFITITKNRKAK